MLSLEDLPNELLLIILTYLTKFELLESILTLNNRFNILLIQFLHHIYLSSSLTRKQWEIFCQILLPNIDIIYLRSLTINDHRFVQDILDRIESIDSIHLQRLKLIDDGMIMQQQLIERFQPEILNIVITPVCHERDKQSILRSTTTTLKQVKIQFETAENTSSWLSTMTRTFSSSFLIDIRVSFSTLTEYFQSFISYLPSSIKILHVHISSAILTNEHRIISFVSLPDLIDFELNIDQISFPLINRIIPMNDQSLRRLALTGEITMIEIQPWRELVNKFPSLEQLDLCLSIKSNVPDIDPDEWKYAWPRYPIEYNPVDRCLRTRSSRFGQLDTIHLNECVTKIDPIFRPNTIYHLIIRSQYWRSSFDLSFDIQRELVARFHRIRRLSTTNGQLELFVDTKFLQQIEHIDIEFAEAYGCISMRVARTLTNVKSIYFSSMYHGEHQLSLHRLIKDILCEKFPQAIYVHMDAVRIMDENTVEKSIRDWYPSLNNKPTVSYIEGESLSVWF